MRSRLYSFYFAFLFLILSLGYASCKKETTSSTPTLKEEASVQMQALSLAFTSSESAKVNPILGAIQDPNPTKNGSTVSYNVKLCQAGNCSAFATYNLDFSLTGLLKGSYDVQVQRCEFTGGRSQCGDFSPSFTRKVQGSETFLDEFSLFALHLDASLYELSEEALTLYKKTETLSKLQRPVS